MAVKEGKKAPKVLKKSVFSTIKVRFFECLELCIVGLIYAHKLAFLGFQDSSGRAENHLNLGADNECNKYEEI